MRYFSTFAVVFLVSFLAACSDHNISIHESSEKSERSIKSKNCTSINPCLIKKGVKFWLDADTPKPETPFGIMFKFEEPIDIQTAYLEGVSMYMGKIPVSFVKEESGKWRAEAMVGSCNLAEMQWKLRVFDSNDDELNFSPSIYTYR
ncbi:hypothetical protein N474_15620 [Pseudoalteromonas luteoviolacea CPMOR-2]|nr:hypothetical protein N474_15620 [Pseudoalteromonas luteoviolacea CPMOR-2]